VNLDIPDRFQAEVRRRHRPAFILCEDVVATLKHAISKPRRLSRAVPRAFELLMYQAHKSLLATCALSSRALTEDASTLTRRLLEIAVTAGYIAYGTSADERDRRAGCYLSQLWNETPPELRKTIPLGEQRRWHTLVRRHHQRFAHTNPCRLPKFVKMFVDVEQTQTYEADYSLLSSIAHGRAPSLVQDHASCPIPILNDSQVSTILVFACRYYLAVADLWNRRLCLMPTRVLKPVIQRSVTFFKDRKAMTAQSNPAMETDAKRRRGASPQR